MIRWLVVVLALVAASCACGPAQSACGPSTCAGCCDDKGQCFGGRTTAACGKAGGACAVCPLTRVCTAGECKVAVDAGSGGGGGDETGGGAGGGGAPATGGGAGGGGGGVATGGGTSSGGGIATGGGTSSGGGAATGGGTSSGGGGGTATGGGGGDGGTDAGVACGSQTDGGPRCTKACCPSGCCNGNVCVTPAMQTQFACGMDAGICQSCGTGSACVANRCAYPDAGFPGQVCSSINDCQVVSPNTNICRPHAMGWPSGYCSPECFVQADCLGDSACGFDNFCYSKCGPVGTGQTNCRPGYVCDSEFPDGGGFAFCVPDCRTPGFNCGSGEQCRTFDAGFAVCRP